MSARLSRASRASERLSLLGVWLAVALFVAIDRIVSFRRAGRPAPVVPELLSTLTYHFIWAALALPIAWLGRRFPPEGPRRLRALAVHLPASFAASFLHLAIEWPFEQWIKTPSMSHLTFQQHVVNALAFGVLFYWVILAISRGFAYGRLAQEREQRAAHLETSLARAQLRSLRAHLQPHFLFNTLHSISALVHTDPPRADRMIARLSDLLRQTMDPDAPQEVTLAEELELLARYVDIQEMRFGDRLRFQLDATPESLPWRVPHMVLQPLVENSIRHAVADRPSGGTIEVRLRVDPAGLCLEVLDDGPGAEPGAPVTDSARPGLGLASTRARVMALYGERAKVELEGRVGGGAVARVRIPRSPMHVAEARVAGARAAEVRAAVDAR